MKQKVQIDVLDVSLYDRADHPEESDSTGEPGLETSANKNLRDRWWKSKKIWLAFGLAVISTTAGLAFFLLNSPQPKKKSDVKKPAPFQKNEPSLAALQDFIISFKDHSGKDRVFVCSFFLETSAGENISSKENVVEFRKVLYRMLQKKNLNDLSLNRNKNALKDQISMEINQHMSGKPVSKVYFTKFVIF